MSVEIEGTRNAVEEGTGAMLYESTNQRYRLGMGMGMGMGTGLGMEVGMGMGMVLTIMLVSADPDPVEEKMGPATALTGTNKDLRKLTMQELEDVLVSFGVPKSHIDKLLRY